MADPADLIRWRPSAISRWRPERFDVAAAELPLIAASDARPILPELDLWDSWPLEHPDGRIVRRGGREWWFMLSAPRFPDPGQRHDAARIRLIARDGDGWHDFGPALPDDANPGSREWAGSAVLWDEDGHLSLFFTAAGRRDRPHSFEQRMFVSDARLTDDGITGWTTPRQIVASDGRRYSPADEADGEPGAIKAFRDPAFFRDPATGADHVLFAASAGWDADSYNGVVGVATRDGDGWRLDDPLVEAVGVNNELERPHIRMFGGRYYLFFSTQGRTFSPEWQRGPNGLYGLVADTVRGPWRPVNGSGLIAANPASEPTQAYSWWVDGDGRVHSFIDHWGMRGRGFADDLSLLRGQFGGTPAPVFAIAADGNGVRIER
ncbi:MAG: glycoside hydrolase family 68 protein [Sphingomonas sp.]|uniref:glycoside hydrolase family 68 protein n=1 Tax=Sphingomonas sp. TaxID=28214 RepID=UPI001AD4768F|nr:glycoside hydrolase family 68 protein [Sphingomonas sp.]MBN8806642.1 glycoside hydrolase family 68 protein [Sphingomonas sp.]